MVKPAYHMKRPLTTEPDLVEPAENDKRLKIDNTLEACPDYTSTASKSADPLVIDKSNESMIARRLASSAGFPDRHDLCFRCKKALQIVFMPMKSLSSHSSSELFTETSVQPNILSTKLRKSVSDSYRDTVNSYIALQWAAKSCSMCSLAWLIMKKHNGVSVKVPLIHSAYLRASFGNDRLSYDENGCTDIDELLGRQNNEPIRLRFSLIPASVFPFKSNLLLEFDTSNRTGVKFQFTGLGAKSNHLEERLLVFVNSGNKSPDGLKNF